MEHGGRALPSQPLGALNYLEVRNMARNVVLSEGQYLQPQLQLKLGAVAAGAVAAARNRDGIASSSTADMMTNACQW
eukprot:CAMPEP_0119341126 /NCGR_PEP_ID=MMETSP1333-20130426/101686_1 /TAXON_ID=418940 /ORGANISM="Scyphosphaera apsteinii, Strain RCC1455" /LENGTH=76 /DNA_ID=CAMNT_0007353023 /DNA_START=185 /DNA_END=412 /DNA_ORIENTATION=-